MKWLSSAAAAKRRRSILSSIGLLAGVLLATPAQAAGMFGDLVRVSELNEGLSLESKDGAFTFSDFEFTAIDFDDRIFDLFFVAPKDSGFRLVLGFLGPWGPGNMTMAYTVTANGPYEISGASIPRLSIFDLASRTDLVQVAWEASNGAGLYAETDSWWGFDPVSTEFDGIGSLEIEQLISVTGRVGITTVQNSFQNTPVPEPTSGLLVTLGLGFIFVASRRRA